MKKVIADATNHGSPLTMSFSDRLRIAWWLLLVTAVTWFIAQRHPDLVPGRAAPADIVVFLVWVALLLVPLFQELEFFGLKFRQEIQSAKEEVKGEIASVRSELRNAVDILAVFSPQITFPVPLPDSQLPDVENRVKAAVEEALASHGLRRPPADTDLQVPKDAMLLFATRFNVERELRRIARQRDLDIGLRRVAGMQLSRALVQAGVIEPSLDRAIREVYAVSSAGVHAEDVTPAQAAFVRDVASELVGTLKAI